MVDHLIGSYLQVGQITREEVLELLGKGMPGELSLSALRFCAIVCESLASRLRKWQTSLTISSWSISARFAQRWRKRFTQMDKRFDEIDKRFEDFHALSSHTLMLSTSNSLRSQELERRYELGEGQELELRQRMDELERRLTSVEDKIDR